MKTSIIILATVLIFAVKVNAQVAYEVQFSGGASTIQGIYGDNNDLSESLFIASYQLGGALRLPTDKNFEFVLGLNYGMKGTRFRQHMPTTFDVYRLRATYLEIPIRGRLLVPTTESEGFFVNYGAYVSYTFRAGQEIEQSGWFGPSYEYMGNVQIGNDPETDVLRPFEGGSTFGFGYYFQNFQISFDTQIGLTNILAGGGSGDGAKYRMFSLTFAQRISNK